MKKLLGLLVAGITISAMVGCSKPTEGEPTTTTPPANTKTDGTTPPTNPGANPVPTAGGTAGATAGTTAGK